MTNTLAHYKKPVIYRQKKFYNIGPWFQDYKTFFSVTDEEAK
jgi:hypothetical protein